MTRRPRISVRDWRRRPPQRLTVAGREPTQWIWVYCGHYGWGCDHKAAIATAPYIIRWGPDDWVAMLRRTLCCSACGRRGIDLKMPSWGGMGQGWTAMPVDEKQLPRASKPDDR